MELPLTIFAFFLGLVIGSFLNVAIRPGERAESLGGRRKLGGRVTLRTRRKAPPGRGPDSGDELSLSERALPLLRQRPFVAISAGWVWEPGFFFRPGLAVSP